MKKLIILFVAVLLLTGTAIATPITMDFTGVKDSKVALYTEDGFDLSGKEGHWHIEKSALKAHKKTIIQLAASDSSTFDFMGFDLWKKSKGLFITSNLGDEWKGKDAGTYELNWKGVSFVTITGGKGKDAYLDNLVADANPVIANPEPTTIALLGIGIGGLAGAEVRRRRRQKAVGNS